MRLLNVETRRLQEFFGEVPRYVILSHTWGNDEVTFQDLDRPDHTKKRGYTKIDGICCLAARNGFKWVWVDTCCIDKTSSAELSEAINSMYKWYKDSSTCCAYLEDVQQGDDPSSFDRQLCNSRWFTRGWTLQELLAPETVEFFDAAWENLGTRSSLAPKIESITKIPTDFLERNEESPAIRSAKIAMRMSWAARRQTTRVEDIAYSLLGIFDVNMPLLYGEGEKAFERLQIEIMKQSSDDSILAWASNSKHKPKPATHYDEMVFYISQKERALARCPDEFAWWTSTQPLDFCKRSIFGMEMTIRGLRVTLPVLKGENVSYGVLNCMMDNSFDQILAVRLRHTDVAGEYERAMGDPIILSWQAVKKCQQMTVYISNKDQQNLRHRGPPWHKWLTYTIRIQGSDDRTERLVGVEPEHLYREEWSSVCVRYHHLWRSPRILLHYEKFPMDNRRDSDGDWDGFIVVLEERKPRYSFFSFKLKPPPFVCYTIPMLRGKPVSDNQHEQLLWQIPRSKRRDFSNLRNIFSLKAGVPQVKIQREKFLDQEWFLLKIVYTKSLAQYAMPITRAITSLRPFIETRCAHA
ncbi:HET domain-containing protein [Colletotrichum costaricense]|uniref:HET domain-containing protein n=1 Tax=Colletotrichum costaricense TaxID=1209916 RepID=A0AAI9YHS9_9PEZI|nr:HET domain-containing protein [Colletotrichum costaricense]KAK1510403.1 HET domain-containing protein [Colletotrichum costaricense]